MPVRRKAAHRPWWASPVTWLLLFGVWGSAIFGYWSYTHGKKVERNAAALHANYKSHTHSSREDREESSHSSSGYSSKPSSGTNKALAVGIGGWDNQDSSSVDMIVSSNSGPKVDGYKAPRDVALRSGTMYKDGVQVDPGTRVEEMDVQSMEAAVDRAIDRIEQRLNAGKGNGSGKGKGSGKAVVSARASASESASSSTSSEDTKKPSERAQRGSGGPYVRLSSGAKDRIEVYAAGHDVHVKPQVVVKALEMVQEPKGGRELCVIEVGTAEGKGTTHALTKVLDEWVRDDETGSKRDYMVHTYEGVKEYFNKAKAVWGGNDRVKMYNELVMTGINLNEYVLANVAGPPGKQWPNKGFYEDFYKATAGDISSGKIGGWFRNTPDCKADLILIDGTRFSHAGIIATLLEHKELWDKGTVWMVEDDGGSEASEREIAQRIWELERVSVQPPGKHQDHPWFIFQVAGCKDGAPDAPGC